MVAAISQDEQPQANLPWSAPQVNQPYFVDTHCHVHDRAAYNFFISRQKRYTTNDFMVKEIFNRAEQANVRQMICVGTTHDDSIGARIFAKHYDNVFWSYGVHPEETKTYQASNDIEAAISNYSPVAIGEIGLDYHTPGYDRAQQIKVLELLLDVAKRHNLPVIFHIRDAYDDVWPIIDNFCIKRAVLHSFSDTRKNLEQGLDRGFMIGLNGLYTFAPDLPIPPLNRTILETDSPFLAPNPYRGLPNEPAHIKCVAEWLAQQTNVPLAEIAQTTTKNAALLFGLPERLTAPSYTSGKKNW